MASKTFYSNKYGGRQLRLVVSQDVTTIYWTLYSEGGSKNWYSIDETDIIINGSLVYHNDKLPANEAHAYFPVTKGHTSGSITIPATATSIQIIFRTQVYSYVYPNADYGGILYLDQIIYPPSLSSISVSSVGDHSAYASFYVTNNNNQAPYSPQLQVGTSNFGGVVSTIYAQSGTFTNLDANRTYYVRGSDANNGGRSYTNVASFTTAFYNPGNPGKPRLSYNTDEPIPAARITASWSAASAGSTSIAGYRVRLFKNGSEVAMIDTGTTATSYTFNTLESYGIQAGDSISVGIYAYCFDWQWGYHFNGGGASSAQIFSNSLTIVSDKFLYISVNGGSFNKRKAYISDNGGTFKEIKKEKLKVIR